MSRLRDAVLLALLVILVFVSLPVLVVWLFVALFASAGFGWGAPRTPRTPRNVVILALLVLVGIVLLPPLLGIGLSNALLDSVDGLVPEAPYGLVTIVVLAFAVIAVNEFTVHHLVYTSFRRSRFAPDGRQAVTGWEGPSAAPGDQRRGPASARRRCHRHPTVVFVTWPERSVTGLTRREQVLMAAYRLATNRDTQLGDAVLRDLYRPPAADLPVSVARRLADAPAGTDQRMLFLEWNFYILPPIRNDYRRIDRLRDPFLVPLRRTIADFVTLPATAIHRVRSVFRRFDPLRQREGEIVPDRYGAAESLRELAADDDVQNYFQDVDVQRRGAPRASQDRTGAHRE